MGGEKGNNPDFSTLIVRFFLGFSGIFWDLIILPFFFGAGALRCHARSCETTYMPQRLKLLTKRPQLLLLRALQ